MSEAKVSQPKRKDVPFQDMSRQDALRIANTVGVFRDLDGEGKRKLVQILCQDARILQRSDGEIVVRKGDWGNSAFFIVSGTVVLAKQDLPLGLLGRREPQRKSILKSLARLVGRRHPAEYRRSGFNLDKKFVGTKRDDQGGFHIYLQDVSRLVDPSGSLEMRGPEDYFGEISALGRSPRTATIFCKGDVELLEIRWQGLRDLMKAEAGFRDAFNQRFRHNALREYLRSAPQLRHLQDDPAAIGRLAEQVELKTYGDFREVKTYQELARSAVSTDKAIVTQGEFPQGAILIRSGVARVSEQYHHGQRTVSYLSKGHMYGLEEIVSGRLMPHTLTPLGFLMAVVIPTPLVREYIIDHPKSPWRRKAVKSGPRFGAMRSEKITEEELGFLVDRGFVNGTASMVINLDRCTRCDDCVKACASTHDGNPRFLRHGPVYNQMMVANACMHCHDPICMIDCPTGAIAREKQGEVTINDDTCIGCGNCARNCPYEAIRMVEIRQDEEFWQDGATRRPIQKATKCDLCADSFGGPACQRACPHDALVRLDLSDIQQLDQWQVRHHS